MLPRMSRVFDKILSKYEILEDIICVYLCFIKYVAIPVLICQVWAFVMPKNIDFLFFLKHIPEVINFFFKRK